MKKLNLDTKKKMRMKIVKHKDNNEDENFDWLKDLIDEIDREEQVKNNKKQYTATSFTQLNQINRVLLVN